ncbi:MAG: DUF2255 family protein [Bacteroidota bacterium]
MTEQVLEFIQNNNLIGIKAGKERETFLKIWMVVVQGRIFARSWNLSQKSWYTTFLDDPKGQIQCGETAYPISARIPKDLDRISEKINQAYLAKYNYGENGYYAQGIVQEKHWDKTLELMLAEH